jgi:hypothetical protein
VEGGKPHYSGRSETLSDILRQQSRTILYIGAILYVFHILNIDVSTSQCYGPFGDKRDVLLFKIRFIWS